MHRTDKYSEQLNHLASLAKWLSDRLRTKWFWVRVQLQSLLSYSLIRQSKAQGPKILKIHFQRLVNLKLSDIKIKIR